MNGWLVLLVVGAAVLVVVGVQITARQIQQFPVDVRNPGSLFETSRARRFTRRPAELSQLYSIVTESLSSDAVAGSKLRPLLDDLRTHAPNDTMAAKAAPPTRRRRSRGLWLEGELADLEARWGIVDGS